MSAAVHTAIEDQNIHFDVKVPGVEVLIERGAWVERMREWPSDVRHHMCRKGAPPAAAHARAATTHPARHTTMKYPSCPAFQANLGTLVAVTGVILFWRGVWNMWCEGWVGIDGMSVRVGEGGGSTPFAGAGARELPPLDPRTPVRRPCSPFLSPWPLQGHGGWPLAHQRPAVHGHRLGHHALHPLLPGAPGADVPGDVNTFGVAWARWRCAPVHLPLLRGTSMV